MKIGLLIPQSKVYPQIGKEFIDGLKLITSSHQEVEFIIEGIGFSDNSKIISERMQKLVLQDDCDLITGFLGHMGINELAEQAEGLGVPFLINDLGINKPVSLNQYTNTYCNSFESFESLRLLGKYLVNKGEKNLLVSSCFNDSGYGSIQALEGGIYQSGGQFAGHFITPLNPRENEADLMKETVEGLNPDRVLSIHNSIYAKEHANFLQENNIYKKYALAGSYFSVTNEILKEAPFIFNDYQFVSSWIPELENEQNQTFVLRLKEKKKKEPSITHLLGYETGLIIQEMLKQEEYTLANVSVEGPRGLIEFDNEINRVVHQHYVWQLKYEDGYTQNNVQTFPVTRELYLSLDPAEEPHGGWFNAYLCH